MPRKNSIKKAYSNLKLKSKISLLMITVLIMLSFSFCTISLVFFTSQYKKEASNIAKELFDLSTKDVNQVLQSIYAEIVSATANEAFVSTVSHSIESGGKNLQTLVNLQAPLEKISNSSALIASTYLLERNGKLYANYDKIPQLESELLIYEELSGTRSITMLPARANPFLPAKKAIPLVVPLNLLGSFRYLEISKQKEPDIVLIILLDEEALYQEINSSQSMFFRYESNLEFKGKNILSSETNRTMSAKNSITLTNPTSISNLSLIMEIDKDSYMPLGMYVILFLIITTVFISAIGILIISLISGKITSQFSSMTEMIDQMKEGTYDFSVETKYNDETGTLIQGMNAMYATLLGQMNKIQEEEGLKYHYKSQMLTEQINPHFIYNTLEIINMEVINENSETASAMIHNFAAFLRFSLNQGEDTTTLSTEIEHIKKYLTIMNARHCAQIILTCDYPESLHEYLIPKSILLPLVENSIRHGFNSIQAMGEFLEPTITVSAKEQAGEVTLSVTDNGIGIDIDKAKRIIEGKTESSGHIGLFNIYDRLQLYFAGVKMDFESIPFYKNRVSVTIVGPILSRIPEERAAHNTNKTLWKQSPALTTKPS